MAPSTMHLALALLSTSVSVVLGNPVAQGAPRPTFTGECKSVTPCIGWMSTWSPYPSYCSSIFSLTASAQATVTATVTDSTTTLPVSTVTVAPETTTTVVVKTVRVCSSASSAPAPVANQKRATSSVFPPSPVPSPLKKCVRTNIPAACSCLGIAPGIGGTQTVTVHNTVTATPNPRSTTVTPTVTETSTSFTTIVIGAGAGTPTVVLTSPTPITSVNDGNVSAYNYDDQYFTLNLPFEVELFGTRNNVVDISVNGWIALVQGQSTSSYTNDALPVGSTGASSYNLPGVVFAAYWNDLYVYQGTQQGLYYQISGEAGQRQFSVEWYTSLFSNSLGYYHFIATLYEAVPGAATFSYYQANGETPGNTRRFGTIGVQKFSENKFAQYSYNTPVAPGTELYYNATTNTFTDVTTVTCPNESEQPEVPPTTETIALRDVESIPTKPEQYPGKPPGPLGTVVN